MSSMQMKITESIVPIIFKNSLKALVQISFEICPPFLTFESIHLWNISAGTDKYEKPVKIVFSSNLVEVLNTWIIENKISNL